MARHCPHTVFAALQSVGQTVGDVGVVVEILLNCQHLLLGQEQPGSLLGLMICGRSRLIAGLLRAAVDGGEIFLRLGVMVSE